jgi:hypothetical protein
VEAQQGLFSPRMGCGWISLWRWRHPSLWWVFRRHQGRDRTAATDGATAERAHRRGICAVRCLAAARRQIGDGGDGWTLFVEMTLEGGAVTH